MNTSYGGGRGKRRTQSKDHNSRAAAVVDDPDVPLHSTYPPHHSHNYTAPHDMRRESNQSRNRRSDVDNWQPRGETSQTVHDTRYNLSNVNDSHRRNRSGRDVYDRQDQRDVDLWQPRSGSDHYASSSREWAAEDYPQAFPSSTYDEPNYSSAHANRSAAYEWGVEDDRRLADPAPRYTDDPPPHRWGRDHSRESGGRQQQRFVSDSGWDTRFAERETRVPAEEPSKTEETRKWEPAPAWKQNANRPAPPRNQRNQQHHNNGNRNNHQNKSGKGGKKQWNNNKKNHQRDWRGDDSHLNNWTKRDGSQVANANRIPLKRRQPRSRSHSRSHSPTASYYSRRSGRSHSRSPSPKRMRQSPSPVRPTSSPVVKRQKGNRKRRYQASQAFRERGRTRHRSVSPPSRSSRSVSSASSQSSKDVDRPKTVHRLPTATSIKEIDISLSLSKASVSRSSRPKPSRVLPEIVLDGSPTHTDYASAHPHADSDLPSSVMLPPPQPSALSYSAPLTNFSHTNQELPSVDTLVAAPKGIRPRNAGFKPIGQTSSSLRRFFPGDEDEESDPSVAPPTPRKRSSAMHPDVSVHQPNDLPEPMPVDVDTSNIPVPSTPPFYDPLMRPSFNDEPTVDPRLTKDPRLAKMTNGHGNLHMPSIDPSEPALEVRRNELYSIVSQVGEGTFGKVYKARNTNTGVHVALKRVRMEAERDGFPVTAMREIKLLQSLQHPNVVCLYEMMVSNGSVYMVFEYMDHDLTGVLSQTQFSFTDAQLKSLCQQMLRGLAYLHHKGVIHRDIKGSNILVNNRGELKLADFGLARFYQKRRQSDYTNRVITLWYRPPELLFGTTVYGPEVDMWSAGCIMLELFTKKPVFQGNDEIHQLDVMYRVLGTPSSDRWPGISDMPWYELIKPRDVVASPFRDLFKKWLSPCGLELAEQLLDYDPSQRITAVQALQHPYFLEEDPPPELPTGLSTLEGEWHELETKREKARKRKKEGSMH